jgi:hypothetical protein
MPIRAPRGLAIRLLVATVTGCLALASPASAKYLHLNDVKTAAQKYAQLQSDASTYSTTTGSCWHAGPHLVQCSLTEDARYSGIFENVLVLALRGDKLYGHLLYVDEAGPNFNRPRFIGRV